MNKVSELIKENRIKHKISQAKLAKKFGYSSAQFISNIERGLCSFPIAKAKKLCKVLKIDKEEFKQAKIKDLEFKLSRFL